MRFAVLEMKQEMQIPQIVEIVIILEEALVERQVQKIQLQLMGSIYVRI